MIPKRKITAKTVAKLAGVSQTTVSFVLNKVDGANISEDTKQRVLDAAHHLGYRPDMVARSLASGRSMNIGLILTRPHAQVFIDEFIPTILTGLRNAVTDDGYRIMIELIDEVKRPFAYSDLIQGNEVAGILFNHVTPEQIATLETFASEGFPIVSLDYCSPTIHSVMVDKFQGVRHAVEHLISLGHRRIACITFAPILQNEHAYLRLLAYRETLEAAHIPYDEGLVAQGAYDPDTGYAAMQALLRSLSPPTALFAMNDVMAFGAMAAIRERGLRIPEDIAIVGFDDIRLAEFSNPPLTTIREPDILHGQTAGQMLLSLIQGKPLDPHHIILPTELIIRDSCGYRLHNPNPR